MWIESKVYDRIYSLGTNCRPKGAMRDVHLGCARGPFDWMLTFKLDSLIDVLKNRLDGFFDYENCRVVAAGDTHIEVLDEINDYSSHHDFKKLSDDYQDDMEKQFPEFSAKYKGIVDDFLIAMKEQGKILFFMNLEPEWRGQEGARCAKTGKELSDLLQELIDTLTDLRGGKPFDILIGTYYNELIEQNWPDNIRFFKLDKKWKAFKNTEESYLWSRILAGNDVFTRSMKKGWPGMKPLVETENKKVYQRIYSLGADFLPRNAILNINRYVRRGPFDRLVIPYASQIADILRGEYRDIFPLEKLDTMESHREDLIDIKNRDTGIITVGDIKRTHSTEKESLDAGYESFINKYNGIVQAFRHNVAIADKVLFVLNLQAEWSEEEQPICPKSGRSLPFEIQIILKELSKLRGGQAFDIYIGTYYQEVIDLDWPANVTFFHLDKELGKFKENRERDFWNSTLENVYVDDNDKKSWWNKSGVGIEFGERRI